MNGTDGQQTGSGTDTGVDPRGTITRVVTVTLPGAAPLTKEVVLPVETWRRHVVSKAGDPIDTEASIVERWTPKLDPEVDGAILALIADARTRARERWRAGTSALSDAERARVDALLDGDASGFPTERPSLLPPLADIAAHRRTPS